MLTSEMARQLALQGDPNLGHFQVLKIWIDDYVGILAIKASLLGNGTGIAQAVYVPISIGVPAEHMQLDSGLTTAIPPPPAAASIATTIADPAPSIAGLATNIQDYDSSLGLQTLQHSFGPHSQTDTQPFSGAIDFLEPKTEQTLWTS